MRPIERILRGFVAAAAGAHVLVYLGVAVLRLRYPFQLEWMEGGAVEHVARVLRGQPLYVAPTIEFVPFIYTPLYFYVAAAPAALLGSGFLPLRLVSLLASLGCLVLIVRIAGRHGEGRLAPLAAAGLFAAFFAEAGAFYDVARADSLSLLLFLAGVDRLERSASGRATVLAAVLFALAFFAKQSAAFMALPVVIALALRARRRGIALASGLAALVGGGSILLDALHGGWFGLYVFELPRLHRVVPGAAASVLASDLLRPAAVALLAAGFFFARGSGRAGADRVLWAGIAAGMIGGSFAVRIREGSYDNILMPAYAVLAILFGLGLESALRWASRRPAAALVLAAATAQLAILAYDPRRLVPTGADREAGLRLVETLREIDGDVFAPAHGYLAVMAGKPAYAHRMAIEDLLRSDRRDLRDGLLGEIGRALAARRFGAVLDDGERLPGVDRFYARPRVLFEDTRTFRPVTGFPSRPERLLFPRPPGGRA